MGVPLLGGGLPGRLSGPPLVFVSPGMAVCV